MADNEHKPEGFLERRRARNARYLRHRYKEGFDRLAIAFLGFFALAFVLAWLVANDTYALPPEGTPGALEIAEELAVACDADLEAALVLLCRERVLGAYRWKHYAGALGMGDRGWLFGTLMFAVVGVGLWPLGRWVVTGFRLGRQSGPNP